MAPQLTLVTRGCLGPPIFTTKETFASAGGQKALVSPKVYTGTRCAAQHLLLWLCIPAKNILHEPMKEMRVFVLALCMVRGWNQFRRPLLGKIK